MIPDSRLSEFSSAPAISAGLRVVSSSRVSSDSITSWRVRYVDTVACMAVNDVFVMNAWGESSKATGKVQMLADGNGEYARALGLELDASKFGMGTRGKRFSVIVDDGVVTSVNVEPPGEFGVSSAESALTPL